MMLSNANLHNAPLPMFPTTPQEFINLIAHYYRGEIARMAGWRDRIDRTTNWAITCVAAMISISWSAPGRRHEIMLFAMIIVLLLSIIESRRYRFFDVYRRRVRAIERYYYSEVFDPQEDRTWTWLPELARDLRSPVFFISWREAFCRRLRRNYLWLLLILLMSWLLQVGGFDIVSLQSPAQIPPDIFHNASIGPISGKYVVIIVFAVYTVLIAAAILGKRSNEELFLGKVHV